MSTYNIGLNGLQTAQQLINVAGDNIANANTDGYHAKQANVVAVPGPTGAQTSIGLGSEVASVTREWDGLVEDALLGGVQTSAQLGEEVSSLTNLQALFNEPSASGLDAQLSALL